MRYRLSRRSGLWLRFARAMVVFHLLGFGVPSAAADRAGDEIRNLLQAGRAQAALEAAEQALGERPGDPELMLLQASALEAVEQVEQAIRVLDELIGNYPAAPEPYNNLARLHARRGDLEKAREVLEQGLVGDPAYATLYRNLTGIYEAQARTAYAKALDLGGADPKPDLKPLLVLRAPESPDPNLPQVAPRNPVESDTAEETPKADVGEETPSRPMPEEPVQAVVAPINKVTILGTLSGSEPELEPVEETPPRSIQEEPVQEIVEPTDKVTVSGPLSGPEPVPEPVSVAEAETAATEPADAREPEPEVFTPDPTQALLDWAKAWSEKDSASYLAAYAGDFLAPGGDRAKWAQQRRRRIGRPKWIEVRLDRFQVAPRDDGATVVTARQRYRSNTFQSTVRKRWVLTLENSEWRILSERVLR